MVIAQNSIIAKAIIEIKNFKLLLFRVKKSPSGFFSLIFFLGFFLVAFNHYVGYSVRIRFGNGNVEIFKVEFITLIGNTAKLFHYPTAQRNAVRFTVYIKELAEVIEIDRTVNLVAVFAQFLEVFNNLVVLVPDISMLRLNEDVQLSETFVASPENMSRQ